MARRTQVSLGQSGCSECVVCIQTDSIGSPAKVLRPQLIIGPSTAFGEDCQREYMWWGLVGGACFVLFSPGAFAQSVPRRFCRLQPAPDAEVERVGPEPASSRNVRVDTRRERCQSPAASTTSRFSSGCKILRVGSRRTRAHQRGHRRDYVQCRAAFDRPRQGTRARPDTAFRSEAACRRPG